MPGFLKLKQHWRNLKVTEETAQAAKDKLDDYFNQPKTSYRLRYTGVQAMLPGQANIHLVPLPGKNLHVHFTKQQVQKDVCPTCNMVHPVKTIHLWLDQNASCLVSAGVLKSIQKDFPGGLEMAELEIAGGTEAPPALTLGQGKPRRQVDQENERIQQAWGTTRKGADSG